MILPSLRRKDRESNILQIYLERAPMWWSGPAADYTEEWIVTDVNKDNAI